MNMKKACCLLLAYAVVTSQVHATGRVGALLPRVVTVSSISDIVPMLKKESFPVLKLGTLSLIAGTGTMLIGDMAQNLWLTVLGGGLNACACLFYFCSCAKKAAIKANNRSLETELNGDDIVVYESNGNLKLGLVVEESEIDYSSTGDRYVTVSSIHGMHHKIEHYTIESKQIRHVLNLAEYYSKTPDDQANLDELPLLKDTDVANLDHLSGAVIAFEQNGQNYLHTISEVKSYLGDGIKLVIGENILGRRDVIKIDREGNAMRYGKPLQGIIFLP